MYLKKGSSVITNGSLERRASHDLAALARILVTLTPTRRQTADGHAARELLEIVPAIIQYGRDQAALAQQLLVTQERLTQRLHDNDLSAE